MSKAFTKDDATDEPVVVPPRPPLPAGVSNYVTPRGLASLRAELQGLESARALLDTHPPSAVGTDGGRERAVIQARIRELEERVTNAVVVDPRSQPHDEIRFGARITVRGETGEERRYEIVGVDEADAQHGRVAFASPLARAVLGKRVGDVGTLRTPRGEEELEVVAIEYDGQDAS